MDENWVYPHFRRPPYYITYDHYVLGPNRPLSNYNFVYRLGTMVLTRNDSMGISQDVHNWAHHIVPITSWVSFLPALRSTLHKALPCFDSEITSDYHSLCDILIVSEFTFLFGPHHPMYALDPQVLYSDEILLLDDIPFTPLISLAKLVI